MTSPYVVDTNVLIAASTVDMIFPYLGNAEPPDASLRKEIYDWLDSFLLSPSCILILDRQSKILKEYKNKLRDNHLGLRMVTHKMRTQTVDLVEVSYDKDGHAILDAELTGTVHDRADRKMVAAALSAQQKHGACAIVFATDSDWHGWQKKLEARGLVLQPLIPEYSLAKFYEKQSK